MQHACSGAAGWLLAAGGWYVGWLPAALATDCGDKGVARAVVAANCCACYVFLWLYLLLDSNTPLNLSQRCRIAGQAQTSRFDQ